MYTFIEWVSFFYIYCFFGWCIESAIVSVSERRFVNRGFLHLPLLPLYGFGALSILLATCRFLDKPLLVYIVGMAAATVLEYFTGWLMETLFKTRYWDYSEEQWNLHGRICVKSSLFWGALSLLLSYGIHPLIAEPLQSLPRLLLIICCSILTVAMVIDTVISGKAALDVNKVLEAVANAKAEIEELRAQIKEDIESDRLKEQLTRRRAELTALNQEAAQKLRRLIKVHPTARSRRFNDALEELREKIKSKK